MDKPENEGLNAAEIERALAGQMIGRQVALLPTTGSTNDVALEMARAGAPEGLVVFTEEQTAGRGQRGNRWESTAGKGLWFSFLLRPNLEPADSARLTSWVVQTIADSITKRFSIHAAVKPPNDIYVEDRKVAGVLVELRAQPRRTHLAIVGIGLNTNHQAEDFSPEVRRNAISLAMAAREPVDRQALAIALLQDLDRTYRATFAP